MIDAFYFWIGASALAWLFIYFALAAVLQWQMRREARALQRELPLSKPGRCLRATVRYELLEGFRAEDVSTRHRLPLVIVKAEERILLRGK